MLRNQHGDVDYAGHDVTLAPEESIEAVGTAKAF